VARPKGIGKSCDGVCEEFFRQGDLENTPGIVYTSPEKSTTTIDHEKFSGAVYKSVCLPLFETAVRACSRLQVNVLQLQQNIEVLESGDV
jgi:hypothetical protein